MLIISRPGPGRGPPRRVAGVVVGITLSVSFTPPFLCSRRLALRKFVLAVPLMTRVSMLTEGDAVSSSAAPAGSGRAMWRGSRGSRGRYGTCGAAPLIDLRETGASGGGVRALSKGNEGPVSVTSVSKGQAARSPIGGWRCRPTGFWANWPVGEKHGLLAFWHGKSIFFFSFPKTWISGGKWMF